MIQLNTPMESFKNFFLETSEQEKDIKQTLAKIPKTHSILIKGYKFKWESGNTLKAHNDHVGIINPNTKSVTIAAPWNYGRSFTLLHELAHLVWEHKMTPELKKQWEELIKRTKPKQKKDLPKKSKSSLDQNAEEIFCMVYATHYAQHTIDTYNKTEWIEFIKNKIPR